MVGSTYGIYMYVACKLYVVILSCITGLGVGIAVGIVTSSLVFGIAIITFRIIDKYRMKGNYVLVHTYLTLGVHAQDRGL